MCDSGSSLASFPFFFYTQIPFNATSPPTNCQCFSFTHNNTTTHDRLFACNWQGYTYPRFLSYLSFYFLPFFLSLFLVSCCPDILTDTSVDYILRFPFPSVSVSSLPMCKYAMFFGLFLLRFFLFFCSPFDYPVSTVLIVIHACAGLDSLFESRGWAYVYPLIGIGRQ